MLEALCRLVGRGVGVQWEDPLNRHGMPCRQFGVVVSRPEQHGFRTAAGGWALFGRIGDAPSYRFGFLPKGKRKPRWWCADGLIAVDPIEDFG